MSYNVALLFCNMSHQQLQLFQRTTVEETEFDNKLCQPRSSLRSLSNLRGSVSHHIIFIEQSVFGWLSLQFMPSALLMPKGEEFGHTVHQTHAVQSCAQTLCMQEFVHA